jgi:hypothetical protein
MHLPQHLVSSLMVEPTEDVGHGGGQDLAYAQPYPCPQ